MIPCTSCHLQTPSPPYPCPAVCVVRVRGVGDYNAIPYTPYVAEQLHAQRHRLTPPLSCPYPVLCVSVE